MLKKLLENINIFFRGYEGALYSNIIKSKYKKINIYGTGEFGQEIIRLINIEDKLKVGNLYDRNAEHFSFEVDTKKVYPPQKIQDIADDQLLVIASEEFKDDMYAIAKDLLQNKKVEIISLCGKN